MRITTALRTTLLAATVAALASGCGAIEGKSTTATPTTTRDIDKIVVFDPCTQISDDVLASMGLDPASKNVVTNAPEGPTSWRVCNWTPKHLQYAVAVFSTSHTLNETRTNKNHTDIRETTVGGRPAVFSRDKSDPDVGCYVSFSAQQGMFEINATWMEGDPSNGDICAIAMQYATAIEPHLPK
ncbi:DUF3558 domain-containing protein [Nocardia paucivorans]|uniref:DUF3558 domain-containing protein n=1 Tax=Nocardia paucivorans TaxID=114259 RepID=UPI000305297A|nr:DUF3558 domain-containing protein [Nocardia paucivorans]